MDFNEENVKKLCSDIGTLLMERSKVEEHTLPRLMKDDEAVPEGEDVQLAELTTEQLQAMHLTLLTARVSGIEHYLENRAKSP